MVLLITMLPVLRLEDLVVLVGVELDFQVLMDPVVQLLVLLVELLIVFHHHLVGEIQVEECLVLVELLPAVAVEGLDLLDLQQVQQILKEPVVEVRVVMDFLIPFLVLQHIMLVAAEEDLIILHSDLVV